MGWKRQTFTLLISLLAVGVAGPLASAQSTSTDYQVNEYYFGTGGELEASSTDYKARQSAGEMAIGRSASGDYQFQGGFNTTDVPLLEVAVDGGEYDLGVLDAATVRSVSATFTIRNYLSSGYVVTLSGAPPTYETHTLNAMSSLAVSDPGTEQFGVNLVDNSSPDVGADVEQQPDGTFSFGTAVAGYDTADMFKFIDGDTIALSPKSSGQTLYTLSIMANITPDTPAGQYTGRLNVVVTPTF